MKSVRVRPRSSAAFDVPGGAGLEDIGPYRLLRPVGRGGLGVVYQAVDRRSGKQVALKVLHQATFNSLAARRLDREFHALHTIRHPNIVRVLDAGVHADAPFLAMELVLGLPLRSYLECDHTPQCAAKWSGSPSPQQHGRGGGENDVQDRSNCDHLEDDGEGGDGGRRKDASRQIGVDAGDMSERRTRESGPASSSNPSTSDPSSWDSWDASQTTDHGSPPLSWLHGFDEPDSLPPLATRYPSISTSSPRHDSRAHHVPQLSVATQRALNRPERIERLRCTMTQLCDGLAFIHSRGLVHRDIKPANILVEDGGLAKLVDFGLVKVANSSSNTAAGHVVGTYRYMSPEQASGAPVDSRTDLYALGGVLYDMLCSHPPFTQHQTLDLMEAIIRHPPPDPRDVNPGADELLSAVAMRLLEKQPSRRFQEAKEVARVLEFGHEV